MNQILKNIGLLIVIIVLSYLTSIYFGNLYDSFIPRALGDEAWVGSEKVWRSIIGLPFAYIFFTILLFKLFGVGNRNKWTVWLLVPPFLFFASGDLKHIYLPIILASISFGLASIIQRLFKITPR